MRKALLSLGSCSVFLLLAGCGSGGGLVSGGGGGGTTNAPVATLSATSISFPGAVVGVTTAVQQVTLTNTGTAALTITSATLSGANASAFTLATTCTGSIAVNGVCTISSTFTPTGTATATASIAVVDNAGTQTINLTGNSTIVSQCKTTVPRKSGPATTTNYAGSTFTGKVMAGSLPMIGASVQLYAAGASGLASTPTTLGSAVTTDSTGSFNLTAAYTCPLNLSTLYLVSRGGKAGATGTTNSGAVLMSAIGTCASVTPGTNYIVNEVTTVASVYALAQFMTTGGVVGATATNVLGLQLASGTAANLANPKTGVAPGAAFPSTTGTAPTARINTVANLVNACVVSAGTACSSLYSNTANSSFTPTNTLDAVLSLAKHPATNVSALYTLSSGSTAFAPALSAAPADWTIFATFSGGGMNGPSGLGIDSTGNVWVANYFYVASLFSNTGTPVVTNGITAGNLNNSYGLAVDQADTAWIPNEQSPYPLNAGLGSMTLLNSSGAVAGNYGSGGLNYPVSVAIDTGAISWIVDYGNSHVTLLKPDGTPISGTAGYTTAQFAFPVAIAVDGNCYGYVANQSSSTITRVALDGSNFLSFPTGSGASGVAVDASNNVWVANYYGNSVGLLLANGTVSSSNLTGGGINHPQGIAVDGSGNVWVANYRGPSLTQLAGVSATSPGSPISPAAGFGGDAGLLEAFAIAIDQGGNIWVTNFGSNTLTEFVGMAPPVKQPFFGPVSQP